MILIKNALVINEGVSEKKHVLIESKYIYKVYDENSLPVDLNYETIDAEGKILIPGITDTHVHFREPGLTHKADIKSESKAAIAGGVTSFFEMPNTVPPTKTVDELNKKFEIASKSSLANYSFYIGASGDNLNEILNCDNTKVCGIKMFMGSSTGKNVVTNKEAIENVFAQKNLPLVVHCEDDEIISENEYKFRGLYGEEIKPFFHSEIRSAEACLKSSKYAVELAQKFGTNLHIAHISTKEELDLLDSNINLKEKKITGEVCINHLWFSDKDYDLLGNKIKCNPSIKSEEHNKSLLKGVLNDKIDTIATDHAPHTESEKSKKYFEAPSGIPLIQYSLQMMLEKYHSGEISLEKLVEKMCHNPNILFNTKKRGFIKEGYFADLVLIDLKKEHKVEKKDILYKCGWSPMEDYTFKSSITHTFVNGNLVYNNGIFNEEIKGMAIEFDR